MHTLTDPGFRPQQLLQSLLLLASMAALLGLMGWLFAGPEGMVWALLVGLLAGVLGPGLSPGLLLRHFQARELSARRFPRLQGLVLELSRRAELEQVPRLYWLPDSQLTAFTVGSGEDTALALSDGLLRALTPRELTGVLAHEISHIRHHDLWLLNLANTVGRLTALLGQFGQMLVLILLPLSLVGGVRISWPALVLFIVAPWGSLLLQLALSRSREYDADQGAVDLTGDSVGLAMALEKLERFQRFNWLNPWHWGYSPAPGGNLLRTHPITPKRIQRLLDRHHLAMF